MSAVRTRRIFAGLGVMLVVLLAGFIAFAWRTALAPIDRPGAESFDATAIERGARLAAIGACGDCHTAPGAAAYSGGRRLPTPFGAIYSTNITPDLDTGIGRWSLAAFQRAMREGVDREGRHLYPAFPYDHFTLVSDEDNTAIYSFLMTRQPVRASAPDNELSFPLGIRLVVAGWKLLFFHEGPYRDDPAHDRRWNRGAYLANGLGHCGACHTPRDELGAERISNRFGGAESDGWYAYAVNSASQARTPWNAAALHTYLRNGWHERHGVAYGPMAPVTTNLGSVPDADVEAIATYVAWVMGSVDADSAAATAAAAAPAAAATAAATAPVAAAPVAPAPAAVIQSASPDGVDPGATLYAAACESCHDGSRALPFGGMPLSLSTAATDESATNLINIILNGLEPHDVAAGAIMPGFATTLTDGQLESLLAYIRTTFGGKPPWTDIEITVREARDRQRD